MNVYLYEQNTYDLDAIQSHLRNALNSLLDTTSLSNKKVVIKVNAVSNLNQNYAYTTNPIFVHGLIRVLKEYNADIYVGDNPPFLSLKSVLKGNGILNIVEKENVKLIKNDIIEKYGNFNFSKEIMDADVLINVPKIKTHALTYFSCAQKNLFGLIYGLEKANFHVKYDNPEKFAGMINDLYDTVVNHFQNKTLIHICDGIDGLEKEGPTTGGSKRHLGYILASKSAISLDIIGLKLCGLELNKSLITLEGLRRKTDIEKIDEIKVIGTLKKVSFTEPVKTITALKILDKQFMKNLLLEHPLVDKNKCIKCSSCVKICPPHTMKMQKGKIPYLNVNKCIRCWCCAEVCPVGAISKSNRPLLGKIIIKK